MSNDPFSNLGDLGDAPATGTPAFDAPQIDVNPTPVVETTPAATATTPEPASRERRPRSWGDAYTWMLVLAFFFISFGCVLLLLEWSKYNFQYKPVGI